MELLAATWRRFQFPHPCRRSLPNDLLLGRSFKSPSTSWEPG